MGCAGKLPFALFGPTFETIGPDIGPDISEREPPSPVGPLRADSHCRGPFRFAG